MSTSILIIVLVASVTCLVLAHRAALWAEARGWIYYRNAPPPPGAVARAANHLAALVHPAAEHVIDDESEEEDRHDGA